MRPLCEGCVRHYVIWEMPTSFKGARERREEGPLIPHVHQQNPVAVVLLTFNWRSSAVMAMAMAGMMANIIVVLETFIFALDCFDLKNPKK